MEELVFYYPQGHEAHYETGHPERPERIEAIRKALIEAGWWETYPHIQPLELTSQFLQSVHHPDYLHYLQTASQRSQHLDIDTYTTPASWQLALQAAGGAAAVADHVWQRRAKRGFALTRPPGHHATREQGMGFCLINNIAVATEYLIQHGDAQRLVIIDLDLHHGNGTQDIFKNRVEVMYLSTHQYPLYPGTGRVDETGEGIGHHTVVNIPLPPGSGDQAFRAVMNEVILPVLNRYKPQMILCSIGFDTHWRDPLGQLLLSGQGYYELMLKLCDWVDQNCDGRIALFLEGGYDLIAGAVCSQAITAALLGQDWQDPIGPSAVTEYQTWQRVLREVLKIHGLDQG